MALATASEAFVDILRQEKAYTIFGIVGSAFMDPLDLFPAAGLRFVSVRHEQNAALMAEGFARASGRVGVCIGQNGPGVTNLVTGVAQAYANHTPVVVITPSVTSASLGTHAIQEVDQMSMFAGITTDQFQVNRPDKIAWALRNAFRAATLTNGPVQIDIPRDYFYGELDYQELTPTEYRVARVGARASEEDLARAIQVLRSASNPVIVAGLGVVNSGCRAEVAQLAERLAAPVATVFQHNDAFSTEHPLGVGPIGYGGSKAAMRVIADADVVLALGTRLNAFGTNPHYGVDYWPHAAKFIHNDIDPHQIGRNRPVAAGLPGDAREVVQQLLAALGPAEEDLQLKLSKRIDVLRSVKETWAEELDELSGGHQLPMAPKRALREVTRVIPRDAIVASDVGNISGTIGAFVDFAQPRQFLGPGTLGSIGVAYSTALGAKLARPERPVIAISGDGAWSMTIQEVMTAVTEGIPVVGVVMNNSQYGAEKRNQYDYFDERYYGTNLDNPDFSAVARAMGAFGVKVDDPDDIGDAIESAFRADSPSVVEITVDSKVLAEPYRRDAFQKPVRHLPQYRS
ncbi:sulfoacetaldehyde acetyltransferase [Rhodococcus opacus]|uniref:sulfoacetaldehyde acetyltransferase n=1 Tax=Rhodococcus opacus TaxID=37919 RepID=UPI002236108F|nr:sulfoacetaldehyde acetyltransferase [Rhodococcus opacus]UZG60373.1 sulfoacetaldehyde acetyltransferase [Rhodococcus opacus]